MATFWFNNGIMAVMQAGIDFSNDSFKVMLVKAGATISETERDTWDSISDVASADAEVGAGGGYTAGGSALANTALTVDTVNNLVKFDADDSEWVNATISAIGAIVYKDTGVAGTSKLIAWFDFGGTKSSSNASFKIEWNTLGLLRLVAA